VRPPEHSPGGAPAKRDLVAGLEKGLAVFEAFDAEHPRLTMSQVAERTGLTRAAARRYVITLAHLGFMQQDRQLFSLTPAVLRLSQRYLHSARLPRIVQPELHKLADALHETLSVGTLDGAQVVCVAATGADARAQPGTSTPAHCTAAGRVLLAASMQPEFLGAEFALVRAQGYACVDRAPVPTLRTLAVPLHDHRGNTVAALDLSVHAQRMTLDQLLGTGLPLLRQSQAALRRLL
jgi:IclR family pca regulon transcriptional regulator